MDSHSNQLSPSQYALRRKELLSLLKKLRVTGAQGELDLPRITVIGNQSAGKSSVVEAISGISSESVPRDAGTCSRCPMGCRLTNTTTGKWSCLISIRREYDTAGNVLDKVSEIPFGPVITNKEDVEPTLRRAQVAVLNPHLNPLTVLKTAVIDSAGPTFVSKQSLPFSRDTICIDLEGPELTDLSFVDLPGLIQNAEPETIKLVEEMVVSHIRGNCLILVALPMTDDIENQKALRLARQEDPDGRRTIGVMTKPDMLTSGSTKARELWLDIIEGRRHPLVHGYYCTRQPDDAERANNITSEGARAAESKFFSTTAPWSTSKHKDRFGTIHLISSLSKLLVGIINDTLPRIMSEAASKLVLCIQELTALPKEIERDPANYMLKLLTSFCDDVHRAVHSGLDVNQLVHLSTEAFREYKVSIRKTAPNFIPVVSHDSVTSSASSTKVDELAEGPIFYLNDMHVSIYRGWLYPPVSLASYSSFFPSSITRELPNNVPFSAKVDLITKFQAGWESATESCLAVVRKHVQNMLEYQIKRTFHRYEHLEGHVRIFVSEIVQRYFDVCNLVIRPVPKAEATPFTQNTHYLADSTAKWSSKYKAKRSRSQNGQRPHKKPKTNGDTATPAPKSALAAFTANSSTPFTINGNTATLAPKAAYPVVPATNSSTPLATNDNTATPVPKSAFPATNSSTPLATNGNTATPVPKSAYPVVPATNSSTPLTTNGNTAMSAPKAAYPVVPTFTTNNLTSFATEGPGPFSFRMPVQGPSEVPNVLLAASSNKESDKEVERQRYINSALAALAALGYHGITEADFGKMVPPDEYETEIQVMAEVRGYFQITYKRVIDTIPSLIDLLFVRAIAEDMQPSLITQFSLGTADAKERYIAENPMMVVKRKELTVRKERLEEVRHALHAFGLS
ncbi:hypothetical protein C0995_005931 [Termitomyces sp. Mi166|nr:hypothetical protein C0995_005931 [Termitomyces sp. Mi166\